MEKNSDFWLHSVSVYAGISELDPVVHERTGTNKGRAWAVSSVTNDIKIMNGNELVF